VKNFWFLGYGNWEYEFGGFGVWVDEICFWLVDDVWNHVWKLLGE